MIVLLHGHELLNRWDVSPNDMLAKLNWFTAKHGKRKWGAVISNAMAVLGAVLTEPDVQQDIRARMEAYNPDG